MKNCLNSLAGWILLCGLGSPSQAQSLQLENPLSSWNDGEHKASIVEFVKSTTDPASSDYVPPHERIAVFDNDGTLWTEQPIYIQLAFALDRVKVLAQEHAEWKSTQPFQAALAGDFQTLSAAGEKGVAELLMATHAGMTSEEFSDIARQWLATAVHPKLNRRYTTCVYQPMLELLNYLRQNQFKTYIVSGGGVEFMRVFAEEVYGIPPEQVIGSTIKTKYELRDGLPVLVRLPEVDYIDDKEGKPVAIQKIIGRRPIAAFGNSDGDYQMLRYTTAAEGLSLGVIIHHTDDEREYAYDRSSSVGRLNQAMDEAEMHNWILIDMQSDWKTIFGPQ
jgi:phosphoserine phosphatase